MSTPTPTLGERMKVAERRWKRVVPASYLLLRLDGRSFHTYTRGLKRPCDAHLMDAMDATLLALCEEIQGVRLGYVESDEISLLVTRGNGERASEWWMGGVEAKILSLSAACASVAFNNERRAQHLRGEIHEPSHFGALFDSRLWTFPNSEEGKLEVANYFLWRQRDSIKNSVNMAAHTEFGHKAILKINVSQKQEMLRGAKKPWEDLNEGFRFGRFAVRKEKVCMVEYVDKRTGESKNVEVTRNPFVVNNAFSFSEKREKLNTLIPDPT